MFRHKDQQRDELYRGESIKPTLCHHKDFYTWYIFVMQFYLLYCKDRSWNKITDKTYFSLVILGLRQYMKYMNISRLLYCMDRSWNNINTDKTYFSRMILGLRLRQRDLVWRSWCHRLQWHHKKIFTTQVWCAFALVSIWFGLVWFGLMWFCFGLVLHPPQRYFQENPPKTAHLDNWKIKQIHSLLGQLLKTT